MATMFGGNCLSDTAAAGCIEARKGKHPNDQRVMFAKEQKDHGTLAADLDWISAERQKVSNQGAMGITVASCNIYYCRCRNNDTGKETISPKVSFSAIEKLLDSGVDVITLNEVVFSQDICGAEASAKNDSYNFEFYSREEFDDCGTVLDRLEESRKDIAIVSGGCYKATMYHKAFGNAMIINTDRWSPIEVKNVRQLLPPIPGDHEGRGAIIVTLQNEINQTVQVCGTHLTEKICGQPGERQTAMVKSLLRYLDSHHPVIMMGDMNINQVGSLPPKTRTLSLDNPFLHPAEGYSPYELIKEAGFTSIQDVAKLNNLVLPTVWNGTCVDYLGARGAKPMVVAVVTTNHENYVLSDHAWPVAFFEFPRTVSV